jgi:hypothetical protein
MIGIKVSLWIGGILVFGYLITQCLHLISAPDDFMVIGGIAGLLVLLAIAITILIRAGKSIVKSINKWKEEEV